MGEYMTSYKLQRQFDTYRAKMLEDVMKYVREYGENCNDFYINEFGLPDGEDGERTTIVLDFFNNNGCCFFEQKIGNEDTINDKCGQELEEALMRSATYTAMQCLYIVEDENGEETLMYYCFYNDGVQWDDDCEPLHDSACNLSLVALHYIMEAIKKMQ